MVHKQKGETKCERANSVRTGRTECGEGQENVKEQMVLGWEGQSVERAVKRED